MKAAVYTRYGGPEVVTICDVPKPAPSDKEVLIKIHATSVNRTDCGFLRGKPYIVRFFAGLFRPKQTILGGDFAGIVESVGKNVTQYKVGDAVFGISESTFGAHAEYICLPETDRFTLMPSQLSFEQAGSITEGMFYAWNYVNKVDFSKPNRMLIYGATGAIGTAAVQLAKYHKIEVTAVANTKNIELVRSLGANVVLNYQTEDFTATSTRFDVILDAVGKTSFFQCKKILAPHGLFMATEFGPWLSNLWLPLWTALFGTKKVRFPLPTLTKGDVEFFAQLIREGHYTPVVDRTYQLSEIGKAYEYVETGEKTGNVSVLIG